MNRITTAIIGCAGLAWSAMGAVNTRVEFQVSMDQSSWGTEVQAAPGETVYARTVVSYIGTAAPLGLASFVFQPSVGPWHLSHEVLPFVNNGQGGNTSNPLGVVTDPTGATSFGRVSPWGRTSLGVTTALTGHEHAPIEHSSAWMRIAQRHVTSWIGGQGNTTGGGGVPISQLSNVGRTALDPAFSTQLTGIVVFTFAFRVNFDPQFDVWTPMTVDALASGFGNWNPETGEREVYWFGSMNEATGSIRGTAQVVPGYVHLVPSPGVVGVLVAAGMVGCGSRRR